MDQTTEDFENLPVAVQKKLKVPEHNDELLPAAMKAALKAAQGDVVLAANKLGTTVGRLDRAIRLSKQCLRFVGEIQAQDTGPYKRMSRHAIEEDIERRSVLYRSDALDALHELAMMPLSENSAQNQVKLAACARLYTETKDPVVGNEMGAMLQAINADFQAKAPRLRSIRQTVREVTFEEEPPVLEGVATSSRE